MEASCEAIRNGRYRGPAVTTTSKSAAEVVRGVEVVVVVCGVDKVVEQLRKWGGRVINALPHLRSMRYLTGVALLAVASATAWTVLFPMAVYGEFTYCESNVVIRWGEFALVEACAVLGLVEAVLSFRKEKEEK